MEVRLRWGLISAVACVCACGRFGYDEWRRDAAMTGDGRGDGGGLVDATTITNGDGSFPCPAACNGGCGGNECHIIGDAIGTPIVCPAGVPCVITCAGNQGCKTDIQCGDASSCHVLCTGDSSCYFGIECGAGPCTMDCIGTSSCPAVNHCNDSAQCNITCSGQNSCQFTNHCGTGPCNVDCTGDSSCKGSVECLSSCKCDVTCAANAWCPNNPGFVTCPTGCTVADGCDSTLAGCSTCQ